MPIALKGNLVPLSKANPGQSFAGRIYLNDSADGVSTIEALKQGTQAAPPGFSATPIVETGDAFIYPGLIDLHSHIGYNTLPLWTQPGEPKPFLHHHIWPGRSTYKEKVSWPAWVLAKAAPEALLTYVQVRALAGGTTSIQGWPSANRSPANHLVRNIDDQKFGGRDMTRTSVITLDVESLRQRADHIENGLSLIYHCAEGQVGSRVIREFDDVATANCLRQRLIAIHCTAMGNDEFARWKARSELAGDPKPGAVVWSPFSNLWLYGQNTDIMSARNNGITVCLGTDWGPSGTKNLLGELKVARLWSDSQQWGLTDFDLVQMVTSSPGDSLALSWGHQLGRLEANALADITVVAKRKSDPWENLVTAREEDILLVIVNGKPHFGTKSLMSACGATKTTSVRLGPVRRRTVLINPAEEDLPNPSPWTWNKALAILNAVRADPIGSVDTASAPTAMAGRVSAAVGPFNDPFILELDMPGGLGAVAGPPPPGVVVDIPPMPSLRHDRNWRATVKNRGFHDGLLNKLDSFYV